jgi:hypothetical protein
MSPPRFVGTKSVLLEQSLVLDDREKQLHADL